MPNDALVLQADDVRDACHWYWRLKDPNGATIADHQVQLDQADWRYQAFLDLDRYLDEHAAPDRREQEEARLVPQVGEWIGAQVLGNIGQAILDFGTPVTVRVVLPAAPETAAGLQYLPLELAHVGSRPLAAQDVSLVFEVQGEAPRIRRDPVGDRLRGLAVFSLPTDQGALNLRQERYQLQVLMRSIARRHRLALDLRVLQYGVTRKALKEILTDQGGWDIIHFSGHGLAAGLVLETPDGRTDLVPSSELPALLRPGRSRLKWLTLSACLSAARTVDETLSWLGLEAKATGPAPAAEGPSKRELSAVARVLVRELGCAVLAMRFPVGDEFAIGLGKKLYEGVLEDELPLTRALQLALQEVSESPLAVATPALFGRPAAELALPVPTGDQGSQGGPHAAGLAYFPPPPERFVGRVGVMVRASAALAPGSGQTGVLFHGMAGAGKSACALELAYHYEDLERFTGFVWYKAPGEGAEWAGELARFALAFETQLSDAAGNPLFPLTQVVGAAEGRFDAYLPRLRQFLEQHSVLLVLDNLETLLRPDGQWREPRWGKLVATLLSHRGESGTVLTSRIRPVIPDLAPEKLRELPIHALGLDEAALLARQLPNLGRLVRGERAERGQEVAEHRALVRRMLQVVQGHPKLIELAEGQAADPATLAAHLDRAEAAWAEGAVGTGQLGVFFREGASQVEAGAFLEALAGWTGAIAATLAAGPRTLFQFLCCLEDEDRVGGIVQANWSDLWQRLALAGEVPELGGALTPLVAAGLVEVRAPGGGEERGERQVYALHPGVAEAGRAGAGAPFQAAVDTELAAFWRAVYQHGREQESQGGGQLVIRAGRSAAPYLMRQMCWEEAVTLLEQVLHRDGSPATVAAVLPLLRRVVEATKETKEGLENALVLAHALLQAGRWQEAEAMVRSLLDQAERRGEFRTAGAAAGQLINLLQDTGRVEEALGLVDRKKDFTRRAGLGPWTQLGNEGWRLQLLNELGHYDAVLAAVEELRPRMAALAEAGEQEEAASPWRVREGILDAGRTAAHWTGRWEQALALNDENVALTNARGAPALELARTRYNAYGPLLRLGRYAEARALLEFCRNIFVAEGSRAELGAVFSAMGNLEARLDHPDQAAAHEKTALRYKYQTGNPRDCAISHFNLANYLERRDGPPDAALAHRLACAVIQLQIGDGRFSSTIQALAVHLASFAPDPPPVPPTFAELCRLVEQVEGVQFAALFARLPTGRATTGDEALRQVLELGRSAAVSSPPPPPEQRPPGSEPSPGDKRLFRPPGEPTTPLPDDDTGSEPETPPGPHLGDD